jgi:hypothetical protein
MKYNYKGVCFFEDWIYRIRGYGKKYGFEFAEGGISVEYLYPHQKQSG